jgi:transcriptional regulator with XRE-family HTH domain
MSRLQLFIAQTGIRPARLAAESGVSRQHLLRLRKGEMEPTRPVRVAIAAGCSRLLRRRVQVSEVFELEGR